MKIQHTLLAALNCLCLLTTTLRAQVPNLVSYQGRVAVGTPPVNFAGPTGKFKFALVNANGTVTYWRNSADTAPADGVPDTEVDLPVTNGLYAVLLGDTSLGAERMAAIPVSVWSNPDVRLRVWFSDTTPTGFQQLTDQRLAPYGYLPDGGVTAAKLADGAVSAAKLSDGAVTSPKLGPGAVQSGNLAAGAVTAAELANGAVTAAKVASDVGLWSVNGADVFRSGGNVGIGTTAPAGKLEIDASIYDGNSLYLRHPGVSWGTTSLFESYRFITTTSGALDGEFKQFNVGAGGMSIGYSAVPAYASPDALYVSGNVGIGTATPQAKLHVDGDIKLGSDSNQRLFSSSGRMLIQAGEVLYLNPFVGGSNVVVGGGGAATNLEVIGEIVSHGITTANAFGPDNAFVGSPGNYIAFGHAGTSEDFIGYKDNTFFLRDSPNGGDVSQPNLDVGGEVTCVALNITSDRNAKEQFKSVNAREVLDKVARLPISEWQYKEHSDARHIGPMAQDFREAFALGHDEKHITSVDADGVALAAIQGLNEKLEEETREKDVRIRGLEKSIDELRKLMHEFAGRQNGGSK